MLNKVRLSTVSCETLLLTETDLRMFGELWPEIVLLKGNFQWNAIYCISSNRAFSKSLDNFKSPDCIEGFSDVNENSKKIFIYFILFLFKSILWSVEHSGLKPHWKCENLFCASNIHRSLLLTTFSRILHMCNVRDMGGYLSVKKGFLLSLRSGRIIAIIHASR